MFTPFLALSVPFSGIFLWAGSTASYAAYCQLTNVRSIVSGDCYSEVVVPSETDGVRRRHYVVVGETDGSRVTLRFTNGETWGTAMARHGGFVLQIPNASGVTESEYHVATVAEANRVMGFVARRGALARASYDSVRSEAAEARTVSEYEADYADVSRRYRLVLADIDRARRDSTTAEPRIVAAKAVLEATRDSVKRERIDWKRGDLEYRVGLAEGRLVNTQTDLTRATERIRESSRYAAEMKSQMIRDSAYLATHSKKSPIR